MLRRLGKKAFHAIGRVRERTRRENHEYASTSQHIEYGRPITHDCFTTREHSVGAKYLAFCCNWRPVLAGRESRQTRPLQKGGSRCASVNLEDDIDFSLPIELSHCALSSCLPELGAEFM